MHAMIALALAHYVSFIWINPNLMCPPYQKKLNGSPQSVWSDFTFRPFLMSKQRLYMVACMHATHNLRLNTHFHSCWHES